MHQPSFQAPAWYQAMTLTERVASLRIARRRTPVVGVNNDLAMRRMQRWRSQAPFNTGSYFTQRLAMDGITEDEFLCLLGEPVEATRNRFPDQPSWLDEIVQAFSHASPSDFISLTEIPSDQGILAFLDVFEPLISRGCDCLRQGIQALIQAGSHLPFNPRTIEDIVFKNLPGQLIAMTSRTLVLELNAGRLQGLLSGETSEERFLSFLERMRQRDIALAFLEEYPVLARQLTGCIERWVNYGLEFLRHLCADWETILATFSPENDPGVLMEIDGGVGDTHRGGRAVLIAKFSSGFRVVYKPKSLAVDVHFQELLAWINGRGDQPSFRTLKILNRGDYGWVEFVAPEPCTSPAEVWHFYERQGGYLALLYGLEATDFHYENLIAVGEHPVLVDLEALFHPRAGGLDTRQSDLLAGQTMGYSVLRVGLLPQRLWATAESEGVDLSGLGKTEGQLTPYSVPYWEGAGTDEMHLANKRIVMQGSHNRPTLNGAEIDVLDYTEAIVTGFSNIYRLLLEHRFELLADNGPIARFGNDEVRVILRATRIYGTLLHESFHPDVLRDALHRDRLFDSLWVDVEHRPYLAGVILAEREDLLQGDIPMFTTSPVSRDLWCSSGRRITDFFDESGITQVRRRLRHLGDRDLTQQIWFIRSSLVTLSTNGDQTIWPGYHLAEPQIIADSERLLAAACAVGDRLEDLAMLGERDASWIGLTLVNERFWHLVTLGGDLYGGIPGIALFLAYLGAITKKARYTTLAQSALTTVQRDIERNRSLITTIGGFDGWGGTIYTLTHLGLLWNQPALLAEAQEIAGQLPALIERDEQFDIINGAAGCIGSLISLYLYVPSDRIISILIQCGDRLIARAQTMDSGIAWAPPVGGNRPLTGFSHGAAGIAWALLELAALTGEGRFRAAALAAMAYERSLFSLETGNWPDLREPETSNQTTDNAPDRFTTAWCHGASGIGLARLRSLPHLDDAVIRAEIVTALRTTLDRGFGLNHSLCHGDLGNLEFLLQASQVLDDSQWRVQVDRLAAIILESISRHGWLCGIPSGVESPGLMTGLAGIGYGLLRLARPTHVPSILVLEPPPLQM